ncbi:MAG: AAA family ATPase [Nanoarchaeota archaeon]
MAEYENLPLLNRKSVIMFYGPPATGKTTMSGKLRDFLKTETKVDLISTFQIRNEFGLTDLYSAEQRETVYREVATRLENSLRNDTIRCIILDGNFNKKNRRAATYALTEEKGGDVYIVECVVSSKEELERRFEKRKEHPELLEHKAASMDLYDMIKSSTDPIEQDLEERPDLPIVTINTETKELNVRSNGTLHPYRQEFLDKILEVLRR